LIFVQATSNIETEFQRKIRLPKSTRKCVLLIVDGLGDLPNPVLDGQTPLEAAHTPVLNSMAASGLYGVVDPVMPGEVPNTHSGSGMLFGVLPEEADQLKRGPVEASGVGRALEPGDIAVRANFASLEMRPDGLLVSDRRAGRIKSGTTELAQELAEVDLGDGVTASLQSTDQHRCVLVLTGPGLDPAISDTDPGDRGAAAYVQPCRPLQPGAAKTAEKIDRFVEEAFRKLQDHPINRERRAAGKLPASGVITRGAGAAFSLGNALQNRGISAAVVAGCNTVIGLARILGFEAVSDSRFTASSDTDLQAKVEAVMSALERHDFVYLHIKAPDLFAHDKNPEAKRDFLEHLDKAMSVLRDSGAVIALTADHTTDSNSGAHTSDPVPTLLYDPSSDEAKNFAAVNFGEKACRNGNMPRQRGHEFLLRLFSQMGF